MYTKIYTYLLNSRVGHSKKKIWTKLNVLIYYFLCCDICFLCINNMYVILYFTLLLYYNTAKRRNNINTFL